MTGEEPEGPSRAKLPAPVFIGRWTSKILFSLKERPHRHGESHRHVGEVSQRMLTRTLRDLESRGLIARRIIRSKPIAVEYSLSRLGNTLIVPLRGMCRWAKRYGKDVSANVHLPVVVSPVADSRVRHTYVPNFADFESLETLIEVRGGREPSMHRKHSSLVTEAGSTGGILAVCIGKFRYFFQSESSRSVSVNEGGIR